MNVRERLEEMLRPNADGLLPCPWCGSPDPDNHQHEFAIICRHCSARGAFIADEKDRVSAWNWRPRDLALLAAIEQRDSRPVYSEYSDMPSESARKQWIAEDDARLLAILEGREG